MKNNLKRIAIISSGWFFIFLGFIGLFLPFLQGILFLLIGLYILSYELPTARKLFDYIKVRFPKLTNKIEDAKERAKKFLGSIIRW